MGYVIVTNAATLARNEFIPFVTCAYTIMHLDPREFACVHTHMHKCKRSFLRAFSVAGLIKTQKAFARKTQTHFGFRNFQDVLY